MAGRHARTSQGPVFVDPSTRRVTAVRVVGWLLAVVVAGYLLLVAVALVGPPGLSRVTVPGLGPVLPGPGAAQLDDGGAEREAPGVVLERTRPPQPSPPPSRGAASPAGGTGPTPSPTPTVVRTGPPSRAPSPTATAAPRRTGPPTPQPKPTKSPPGGSRRPTRSPS